MPRLPRVVRSYGHPPEAGPGHSLHTTEADGTAAARPPPLRAVPACLAASGTWQVSACSLDSAAAPPAAASQTCHHMARRWRAGGGRVVFASSGVRPRLEGRDIVPVDARRRSCPPQRHRDAIAAATVRLAAPCSTLRGRGVWCSRSYPQARRFDAPSPRPSARRTGRCLVVSITSPARVLPAVLLCGAVIPAPPSADASGRLVNYAQARQTFKPDESGRGFALGGPSRRLRGSTSPRLRLTAPHSVTMRPEQAAARVSGRF